MKSPPMASESATAGIHLWPQLFIIGAPKSGTTALASYLSDHPRIAFSAIKEPHYFATDLPRQRVTTTVDGYLALFGPPDGRQRVGAEGSVWYLYSDEAVPRILEVRPDARFVVILRDPRDASASLHQQKVLSADEDVLDFEAAFGLQEERRQGRSIPAACREPTTLLYGDVCSYGRQIERLFGRVARDRVQVHLYDDFAADPGAVYRRVLAFAGLADDGRESFGRVNEARRPRSVLLNRMIRRPSRMRRSISEPLKRFVGLQDVRFGRMLKGINSVPGRRAPVSPAMRRELGRHYDADVRLLERLLERDLSGWRDEGDPERDLPGATEVTVSDRGD